MELTPVFILLFLTILPAAHTLSNKIARVNLMLRENSIKHHTDNYRSSTGSVVLRRGQPIEFSIFPTYYNETSDRTRIQLTLRGEAPITVPLLNKTDKTKLCASVNYLKPRGSYPRLDLEVNLPTTIAVGIWKVEVFFDTTFATNDGPYTIFDKIYLLFNPWCEYDTVYLDQEDARREYILNENGIIYTGVKVRNSPVIPSGKRWFYGQFDENVLTVVMYLLDRMRLSTKARADVVTVSRALSSIVNSQDEEGILVGSWPDDGRWKDGISPYDWTNSRDIFNNYIRSGGFSVKYAQCWVYAGVLTTVLRAMGIPARTVTNYYSAHDTDSSLTIDEFYDDRGRKLPKNINTDMVWNFHVWSEAFMMRKDLPEGYGGWQVLDSTPQERSHGRYQLGPASVKAIKQSKVKHQYDVGFVYSEVNADKVYWKLNRRTSNWVKTFVDPSNVGVRLITKRINSMEPEDLTNEYKYPEKTTEERISFNQAVNAAGLSMLH